MENGAQSRAGGRDSFSKRSSMACTTCRQVKLRCDAMKCFPAPCTRCAKQRISCKFDPKFKRKPVRGSLEKVMEENERLRQLAHASETSHSESNVSPMLPAGSDTSRSFGVGRETTSLVDLSWEVPTAQEIEGIHLDGPTIQELFEHFGRHYLLHFPILDLQKPIDLIQSENPLLYWTIIIISASKHSLYSPYFALLQTPFKHMLSGYLVKPIRCIYSIQALLTLCLWPFPVDKQQEDPSWEYCGMAAAAALKLTSNDSQTSWSEVNELSIENESSRLKTWLGCFVVSTNLAAALALPPPMGSVAHMVPGICTRVRSSLPDEFLIQIEIQGHATRAATSLNDPAAGPLQGSLIELLERDLASVETRIPSPVHLRVEIGICAARIRLCALQMLSRTSPKRRNDGSDTLSKAIWYKGFHTAIRLSNIFADSAQLGRADLPERSDETITIYYPKLYFYALVMAAMYFINFLAIERENPTNDRVLAQNHIKKVYETLLHWSREDRDEAARAANVIDLLSRHVESQGPPSDMRETSHKTPPMSIITNGMKMASKVRSEQLASGSQPRSESSPTWVPELPGFLGGVEPTLWPDDLLEWNTWLANMESITMPQPSINAGN